MEFPAALGVFLSGWHRIANVFARIADLQKPFPKGQQKWGGGQILDIFETPVTVTPQQEISKTLNSSSIP